MTIRLLIHSIAILGFIWILWDIFYHRIFPIIIRKGMKELERNPKWITSRLNYYGFSDVDIVICESKWGMLPRFRIGKNDKLELWIDSNTLTTDIEEIGKIALLAKLKVRHNLWYPEKSILWLSTLLFLLEGGNVRIEEINNKPLD